jgi:methylmalonyl-CoA/ethylmalonyl-CoA epimerase
MEETNKSSNPFVHANQVGIIVKDLKKAVEFYQKLGIGPFVPRFRPPCNEVWEGDKPVELHLNLMFAYFNNIELELIEPAGPGLHMDFLNRTGGGLHHMGFWVDDLDATLKDLAKKGIGILSRGKRKEGGGFALLDTEKYCGLMFEVAQGPAKT